MLTRHIAVYIPSTIHDQPADERIRRMVYNRVTKRMSSSFGGFTATPATGGWYSEDLGKVIEEDVLIVKSYHDMDQNAAFDIAAEIAAWIKKAMLQEAVTIEDNRGIEFV